MNIWANSVFTQKGLALQAKLIKGTKLTITRATAGAGYVTPGLLMQQTTVGDERHDLIFESVTYPEEGRCVLRCRLTNHGLLGGFTAMQVGVYANDPDEGEILYFIAQAESDTGTVVPSMTESPGFAAEWNFSVQYGQADEVEVTVDPANAVSISTYNEGMAKKAEKDLSNVEDNAFFGKTQDASIFTTGGTGKAYTVELPGVTELYAGLTFTMIPHVASAVTGPTLNVNGLGEKPLRQRIASTTGATTTGAIETWLSMGIPVSVTYNGTLWMVNNPRTSASYMYGTVGLENGGTDADNVSDARKNLGVAPAFESPTYKGCYNRVVNGFTEWINPPMEPNTEYRTTERWLSKPVYTQLFQCGALPSVGQVKEFPLNIPGLKCVIDFFGTIDKDAVTGGGGDALPYINYANNSATSISSQVNLSCTPSNIKLATVSWNAGVDVASLSATVQIKYIKDE